MTMTKKHFELVAEAIRVSRPDRDLPGYLGSIGRQSAHIEDDTLDRLAGNLAAQFRMINPRFDRERFMEATRRE